jgi:hypothetical protein
LKPEDVDVLRISHMHGDHVGQAHEFINARLVIGKADFEQTAGKGDPFGPWRGEGKPVEMLTDDKDIFGDGSVVALHLPGHTPLTTRAAGQSQERPGLAQRRSLSFDDLARETVHARFQHQPRADAGVDGQVRGGSEENERQGHHQRRPISPPAFPAAA